MCCSRLKHFAAGLPPLSPELKTPQVCYVTDRKSLGMGEGCAGVLARIRMAAEAGVDWVQIREKNLAGRDLMELARDAVQALDAAAGVSASGARFVTRVIVNDRLDVALASGAAGVHLGRESVSAREVVRWCRSGNAPAEFLVGVSCHSLEEAREAESAGANYIFFGPVFDTPSKRGMGEAQGVARLAEICSGVGIPVMAIGGVGVENGRECIRAGAAGIAAIRMFQDARDAGELRNTLERIR
jgi:thiamine-phosphate pyrophosphorylase